MLRAHLADGNTLCFDLENERQAEEWIQRARDSKFQAMLRGLTIQHNGVMYSLPRPVGFHRVFLFGEQLPANEGQRFKGGERLTCQADESRVIVMIHKAQRAARVSLSKPGAQCYNPVERRIE